MSLLYLPRQFHVNSAGTPYSAAKLYTYRATTTTPLDVYTTSALDTEHTNPVVADANGIFPAIYVNPASGYNLKVILTTSADAEIYTEDNIPRQETVFAGAAFSGNVTVAGTLAVTGATTTSDLTIASTEPRIKLNESDVGTDLKNWDIDVSASVLSIRTRTDADAAGKNALVITRGATTALASIAIGNATDNPAVTINGTTVLVGDVVQEITGTFTGTLSGMSATTTGDVKYVVHGNVCMLYAANAIFGTSNSTGQMTLTGLPAACQPVGLVPVVPCSGIIDNSVQVQGLCGVSGSQLNFILHDGSAVANRVSQTAIFTSGNSKGLAAGWCIAYPLS